MQRIKPLSQTQFLTIGPSGAVTLDFAPLINAVGLTGDFVLGHWNKMLCLPAFYDSHTHRYHVASEENILIEAPTQWVGIPKLANPGILPTSCNYHPNSRLMTDGDMIIIHAVPEVTNGIESDLRRDGELDGKKP